MEEGDDVVKKAGEFSRNVYHAVHYLRKYANKCIELGIPAPFAAEMTRKAAQLLKSLGAEEKKKPYRCYRCHLNQNSTKTTLLRLSVPNRKTRRNKWKCRKRPAQLIAVCKGCGAEVKGGELGAVLKSDKARSARTSLHESLRERAKTSFECWPIASTSDRSFSKTPTVSAFVPEAKLSSSGRRRKRASKLQRLLSSQTPKRKGITSLQNFLETFKTNS